MSIGTPSPPEDVGLPPAPSAALTVNPDRLPTDLLAVAFGLALWVACGSLALAIADGLGEHPARRLLVGIGLVAMSAALLWQRDRAARVLQVRPWLVIPLAIVQLSGAAVDGVIGGAYVAVSLTTIGVAVVVARTRTVWLCVLICDLEYLLAISAAWTLTELREADELPGVVGALIGYPVAATIFLALRRRFLRFEQGIADTLLDLRTGGRAFTPALERTLAGEPLMLPAPHARPLTDTERRVIEGLASGRAPKQLAHEWGVSVATIRTHIRNAKRKTGARTLRELATWPSRPDWDSTSDE